MIIQPEFSRRIPVSRIGIGGLEQTIEASSAECRALAERLQLPAVASFSCRFLLAPPQRRQVMAEAELRAEITQLCVVSLEPFEATVSERFTLRFVPEAAPDAHGEALAQAHASGGDLDDHDIDPSLPDELTYADDAIDIGEAASEQLALALDPYPRMPGIALPAFDGPLPGDEGTAVAAEPPHPFAALARLRGGPRSGGSED